MTSEDRPGISRIWAESYGSYLLNKIRSFPSVLGSWHSVGGELNQILQPREEVTDNGYRILISVFPAGVEIEYRAAPSESRESDEHGLVTRVDEVMTFRGSDFGPKQIRGAVVISLDEGGIVLADDEPLLEGVDSTPLGEVSSLMLRYYSEALFEQCRAAVSKDSLDLLPAELVSGMPAVRRKMNLAHIGRFNDAAGTPYSPANFRDIILPVMLECYPTIGRVDYDRLFIVDRSLLIDCGDCSVLEDVVRNGHSGGGEYIGKCVEAYSRNTSRMSVYEHDNALITLAEKVFPDSASVYVYPLSQGLVKRLSDFYLFRPEVRMRNYVERGWTVVDDRGLRMHFLGRTAEQEFAEQKSRYDSQREEREGAVRMERILEEFDF